MFSKKPFYQSLAHPWWSSWELPLLLPDSQLASISSPVSTIHITFYCFPLQHLDLSDPPASILGTPCRSPAAHHSCVPPAPERCLAQSQPSKQAVRGPGTWSKKPGQNAQNHLFNSDGLSVSLSVSVSVPIAISLCLCLSVCLSLSIYP